MYVLINPLPYGLLLLVLYILADLFRKKRRNLVRRIVFYSFVFYLLNVIQLTMGSIMFPPQVFESYGRRVQYLPFYFVFDLVRDYRMIGLDWYFWHSMKLSFYNYLMLMPLGVYFSLLFKMKNVKKVVLTVFSVSFAIEAFQLMLSYSGVIMMRTFNVDDLILNTAGGVTGFLVIELIGKTIRTLRKSHKRHVWNDLIT